MLSPSLIERIAQELALAPRQVSRALELFAEGNTLPFIARYRKEATEGLDEVQLRDVRDRGEYLGELEDRRAAVLRSVEEQGKLTPELRAKLVSADTKQALEDLYLPFKPKRRTRAMIARERGLEPLAELLWAGDVDDAAAESAAGAFVSAEKEVPAAGDALQGARDILAERVAEDAAVRGWVRETTRGKGAVKCGVRSGKENEVSKFQDYYDFSQKLGELPSHRILAIRRGEAEEFLTWQVEAPAEEIVGELDRRLTTGRRARKQLALVAQDAYKRLLAPSIEVELRLELKNRADEEAIAIFGMNLEQLLLASPAGERVVIGLDPGFRTGVKVAAVSRTGAVLETDTLMLHQPDLLARGLARMITRHKADLVAIGNGTASRETEAAARDVVRLLPDGARPQVVVVSEAGASVYSASDTAREELPDLDVSLRGAVSIARRLQDPLAELVKIDPKAIGVGQYQHDVNQSKLKKRLDEVVEICVNRVGVEVNTASPALLSYVAGVGPTLAQSIVRLRDERGGFKARRELADVPRLGAKAFEQAAGFLRVRGGAHPLDASAVHPERYALAERIASDLGAPLADVVGNEALLGRVDARKYVSGDASTGSAQAVGMPTLLDMLAELRKPGRDPREEFAPPAFRDDVTELKHLKEGMQLEGVVTNVVAFGAFVDVGVHQDGLVHVSQLSDRFVREASEVVKVGQRVKVTVMSVDLERGRVALSMKKSPELGAGAGGAPGLAGRRERGAERGGERAGERGGVRPDSRREQGRPAPKPAAKPPAAPASFKPGQVAPNGMRFK